MANSESSIWKWLATTLGGALLGAVVVMLVSSSQVSALTAQQRDHELLPAHPVGAAKIERINDDIDELKVLLREAIAKMDRYHQARDEY